MIVITPSELRCKQKKYLDLAETEEVAVKRGSKMIRLVVTERTITDEDIEKGLTREELMAGVRADIQEIYSRKK